MAKKKARSISKKLKVEEPSGPSFPIVGIGASAGGLEALESFLKGIPENPNIAIVIVQHLAPGHKGMLTNILASITPLSVEQIEDGTPIKVNSVYVIPPNKELSVHHRVLYLLDFTQPHGARSPIDTFFKSLALDQEEQSIGIILSGMGHDGTEGLRAIRDKAGVCFVQDPKSAKFDGMPKSAIQAGLADIVAPVEKLPGHLMTFVRHHPLRIVSNQDKDQTLSRDLQKIIMLLHRRSGQDFSEYKTSTLIRRIERRMGLHQMDNMQQYIKLLQEMPQQLDLLWHELLIGVTRFFRDSHSWDKLSETLSKDWFNDGNNEKHIRAWIAGCSTGEEAYSMAILFKEALAKSNPPANCKLQIFATDLNGSAIDQAREGVFPSSIHEDVSEERVNRFFNLLPKGKLQIRTEIREMIIFARHNILMDPPFTNIDALICRNVLIYLTKSAQQKLLPIFHFSLKSDGLLFLGSAESTDLQRHLFLPIDKKSRIFRKIAFGLKVKQLNFPDFMRYSHTFPPMTSAMQKEPNLKTLTEKLIINEVSPPSVMVNEEGDILYVSGRTGKYLEPATGKANWNIFSMALESLKYPLSSAFEECLRLKKSTTRKQLTIESRESTYDIDLMLLPISEPSALAGLILVVFKDVDSLPVRPGTGEDPLLPEQNRISELKKELTRTRSELKQTREEMQASDEESKSVNEELQSINEELTTSREEIQSMNEELQTLNAELERKLEDLSLLNNDLNNLLNRTEIATLFLDADLNIRLFTAGVTRILNLIPSDVGRNISDIALKLNYLKLSEDTREVLRTLIFHEEQACDPAGNWYLIRIIPYKTIHNIIDGAVIVFSDITSSKVLESHLRDTIEEQKPPSNP